MHLFVEDKKDFWRKDSASDQAMDEVLTYVLGADLPDIFKKSVELLKLIDTLYKLLKKKDKDLGDLANAISLVVEFMPKVAGGWIPRSLFGVATTIKAGMAIPSGLFGIFALGAGCGLIAGVGIGWWIATNQEYLVNEVLRPAYKSVAPPESSLGSAVVAGGATGGLLMLAAAGPVGWGIGLGALAGGAIYVDFSAKWQWLESLTC